MSARRSRSNLEGQASAEGDKRGELEQMGFGLSCRVLSPQELSEKPSHEWLPEYLTDTGVVYAWVRFRDGLILKIGSTGKTIKQRATYWGEENETNRELYEALGEDGSVELWAKLAECWEAPGGTRWSAHAAEEDWLIWRYRPPGNNWIASPEPRP